METTDTKLALDEIKLNLERCSNNLISIIPALAFSSAVLMVIFTLLSQLFYPIEINNIIYLAPDIYTLVSLLGQQLTWISIAAGLLAAFTVIFSIVFIATMVLFLYKIYEISKNFWSLAKIDAVLIDAKKVYTYLYLYIFFVSISYIIPSFGWILSTIIANIFLSLAFISFHKILKKYGLRIEIIKDTSFLIIVSSVINIIAVCLVFLDISYLLISLVGYMFLFLGLKRFKNQIQYIAPIARKAPPPPTVEAPTGPAPRPSLGPPKPEVREDNIPTVEDN